MIRPALTVTATESAYDDVTERCQTDLTLRPLKPLKNKVNRAIPRQHGNARAHGRQTGDHQEPIMLETLLMAGLLVSVPASLPVWSYSRRWGFKISLVLGVVVLALLILSVADPNF